MDSFTIRRTQLEKKIRKKIKGISEDIIIQSTDGFLQSPEMCFVFCLVKMKNIYHQIIWKSTVNININI